MAKYFLRRMVALIPVILAVTFLIYFVMDLAPGDFLTASMENTSMSAEDYEALRKEYDLDKSVFYRYGKYMINFLKGDLGESFQTGDRVLETYIHKLPNTLTLAFFSVLVCFVLSIPLGVVAALNRGTLVDNGAMVAGLIGLSMPNFWLGLLLIILFSLKLGWLPAAGNEGWTSVIMPAITQGTGMMAVLSRTTRSSMLDVLRSDYLRTARAKGVPEGKVITKHAFRNALIPIMTVVGSQIANLIGGSVVTETVFTWPGVGRMIIDGVNSRDTNVVVGALTLTTIGICVIQLLVDLVYAMVDPRIKARYANGGSKK